MFREIIDLSHPLDVATPVYPGDPPLQRVDLASVSEHGYALSHWQVQHHSGTHLDAPAHFLEHGAMISALGAEQWVGPAMVLSATGRSIIYPDILPADESWRACRFLLFYTGWDRHYGHEGYFSGFPVIDASLAEILARSALTAIGIDGPSPDISPYPVHHRLLGQGVCIIENMRGLDRLPVQSSFLLACIPLPIHAEASWVRPLALLH
jgi:arylformamidase